ncbi:MAG: hypothetical protein M9894_30665 [Planctomycetes bacterium]|nr:hypothetical protein [Planctomycetota bacterium]
MAIPEEGLCYRDDPPANTTQERNERLRDVILMNIDEEIGRAVRRDDLPGWCLYAPGAADPT